MKTAFSYSVSYAPTHHSSSCSSSQVVVRGPVLVRELIRAGTWHQLPRYVASAAPVRGISCPGTWHQLPRYVASAAPVRGISCPGTWHQLPRYVASAAPVRGISCPGTRHQLPRYAASAAPLDVAICGPLLQLPLPPPLHHSYFVRGSSFPPPHEGNGRQRQLSSVELCADLGKLLLGYSDLELANKGGYDLVHYDDLAYVACAHQERECLLLAYVACAHQERECLLLAYVACAHQERECLLLAYVAYAHQERECLLLAYVACAHQELLKTGASGMIAYRLLTRDGSWQWLQTSSRLVYKNSKPDFIICTHRPLMEEEGRDLLGKRTMDFKVSYLDPGLTQSYLCDSELPQLMSRRYKTHLRDFLSTCRSKRSYNNIADPTYNNYSNVYSPTTYTPDNTAASLYVNPQNLSNLPSLYPTSYIPTDNLFHYRQLGSYYPDYMTTHSYVSNGYMDAATRPCLGYDATGLSKSTTADQKFYCPSQLDPSKYASQYYAANTVLPPLDHKYDLRTSSAEFRREHTPLLAPPSPASTAPPPSVPPPTTPLTPVTDGGAPKELNYSNGTRQTVLMWGSAESTAPLLATPEYDTAPGIKKYSESPNSTASNGSISNNNNSSSSCPYTSSNNSTPNTNNNSVAGVQEAIPGAACKWGPPVAGTPGARSSSGGSPHEGASPPGTAGVTGGKGGYYTTETGELWPPHQYYHPYHHPYPGTQHIHFTWQTQSLPPAPTLTLTLVFIHLKWQTHSPQSARSFKRRIICTGLQQPAPSSPAAQEPHFMLPLSEVTHTTCLTTSQPHHCLRSCLPSSRERGRPTLHWRDFEAGLFWRLWLFCYPCCTLLAGGVSTTLYAGGVSTTLYTGGVSTIPYAGGVSTTPYAGGVRTTLYDGGVSTTLYDGGVSTTLYAGGVSTTLYAGGVSTTPYAGGVSTTLYDGANHLYHYQTTTAATTRCWEHSYHNQTTTTAHSPLWSEAPDTARSHSVEGTRPGETSYPRVLARPTDDHLDEDPQHPPGPPPSVGPPHTPSEVPSMT
ncbi:PAS fold-3 [Trinorchestia longiramus]|nr:PAS fold-3 [Trinorchestia longiramus]